MAQSLSQASDDVPPPVYSNVIDDPSNPVPVYSEVATSSEHVLPSAQSTCSRRFVWKTDHLELCLGRSMWGTKIPAYGLHAKAAGSVKFRKSCSYVVALTVTLMGCVTINTSQNAVAVAGVMKTPLISQKLTLISPVPSRNCEAGEESTFELNFPEFVQGSTTTPLPPSFISFQPGVSCDIVYAIQVDLVRKGLRRHEMLCVPVLYLPKTRPDVAPLMAIPHPLLPNRDQRAKRVTLEPQWQSCQQRARSPNTPLPVVSLELPSPQCFASGDPIPLLLTISSPHAPALAKLLSSHVGVFLVKRKRLWVNNANQICVREQLVSQADLFLAHDSLSGTVELQVELQAGQPGYESSWAVEGAAAVEHAIRILIRPPEAIKDLPSFRHEEPVRLTTDQFGTLTSELLAMGGIPTPALGLSDAYRDVQAIL